MLSVKAMSDLPPYLNHLMADLQAVRRGTFGSLVHHGLHMYAHMHAHMHGFNPTVALIGMHSCAWDIRDFSVPDC